MMWEPPRCIHGHILGGCPEDDCPTQLAYLDQEEAAFADWERRQQEAARRLVHEAARRLVHEALGLDSPEATT